MTKKLECADLKRSVEYYKKIIEIREERIQWYKQMNAPEILIKNEKKLLQKDQDDLLLVMYNKGFESGKKYSEMQRLENALFKKPRGRAVKTATKKSSKKN